MPIVVGVDGSEGSRRAVRWALQEGLLRKTSVRAVMVWSYLDQIDTHGRAPFRPDFTEEDAREAASEIVTTESAEFPDVEVAVEARLDLPARGLIEASRGEDLLVVGSRGLGGFTGLLLGSVSQQVALHAETTIVIVKG